MDGVSLAGGPHLKRVARLITEGRVVLFLGSGISISSGAPSAVTLRDELAERFSLNEHREVNRDRLAELVEVIESRKNLDDFMVERLKYLRPVGSLLDIPKYYWKAIYTVNYDTLLEKSYDNHISPKQSLVPIYSNKDRFQLSSEQVPLYKLHGCITRARST